MDESTQQPVSTETRSHSGPEIGDRFRSLVIVADRGRDRRLKHSFWECRCDCGAVVLVRRRNWKRTAGCQSCAAMKHGGVKDGVYTPTYATWASMHQRCKTAPRYLGRGITVCDRWSGYDGFENFLADMGERPDDQTLDRIDVNGNYEPSNCRWATIWEQSRNKTTSKTTSEHVLEVVRRWQAGERAGQITEALGLPKSTVSNIVKGKAFRDLTGLEPTDERMESPTVPEWTPWPGWHSQVLRELGRRDMKQKDLASAIGCTAGGLSSLLRGQVKQTEFVTKINDALSLRREEADPTEAPKERRTYGKTQGWSGTIRVFVGDGWRERSRREMKEHGLTQQYLAEACGLSPSAVSFALEGRDVNLSDLLCIESALARIVGRRVAFTAPG
jgi:predicted XRE-type DNA-binding protein